MKLETRFWISSDDGKKVFGKGPYMLLKKVKLLRSLNKAAKELNMSYSKAWLIIKRAEKALNCVLLDTKTGGKEGGGSCLTEKAELLLKAYETFSEEAERIMQELYNEHFKGIF